MSEPGEPQYAWNYRRRAVGVLICFAPVVLLGTSLVTGALSPQPGWLKPWALVWLAAACLFVSAANAYLAFVRPALYAWRHGSTAGMRNVSGVPLFGTAFVVLGGSVSFGDWRAAAVGLLALATDVGGLPWFLVVTWRDNGFWDGP